MLSGLSMFHRYLIVHFLTLLIKCKYYAVFLLWYTGKNLSSGFELCNCMRLTVINYSLT